MNILNINNSLRGLIGIVTLIGICYLLSSNRKRISWNLVFTGLLIQLIFAIGVLKIPIVSSIFQTISNVYIELLQFTKSGAIFLFGETLVSDVVVRPEKGNLCVFNNKIYFNGVSKTFGPRYTYVARWQEN